MEVITHPDEMAARCRSLRRSGRRIGFVPTMGYLHRAHSSLMELTRPDCDVLVVSIYVNPLQFLPGEDLARYPRDPEGDRQRCEDAGCDLLFFPESLYPPGFVTRVAVPALSQRWEGAARPGHFEGVATVVSRLFGIVSPDLATFGEKDYQQLAVIEALVEDLYLPVNVRRGPLVRDDDGLALSSRNVYLSPTERRRATSLSRALAHLAAHPSRSSAERIAAAAEMIDADELDYLAVVDPRSLEPIPDVVAGARALVAARYGRTRLLDNIAVDTPE